LLAGHGANVAICGRTPESLEQTADEIRAIGVTCLACQTDVSQLVAVEDMVKKTATELGGIDILINNAVTSTSAPFDQLTDKEFDYHINVKLMAEAGGESLMSVA